jgi:hypothetical protein
MFLLLSQPLKQQYSKKWTIGNLSYPHGNKIKLKIGDYLTKKIQLRSMKHSVESIFFEDESIFEPALAHISVDPLVLFDKKTIGWKSHETVPLRYCNSWGLHNFSRQTLLKLFLSNTSSKLGRAILTTPMWMRVKESTLDMNEWMNEWKNE